MMKKFWADESGATAIEYGLILSGLSIVIAVAVATVGDALSEALYGKISDALAP